MNESTLKFGKYHILGEQGRGSFATVYRAVDTALDREVAIKILHPALLNDALFVQHFRQEARTLAALRHPQVITVYEVGEAAGRLFIAMELAHGPSLAQSIARRGSVPWTEMLALLQPVCAALDYAHGQGVIHRDLKPANILLDTQRGPLLTDFGVTGLIGESSLFLSTSGGVLGAPEYIAPEVLDGGEAAAPADIYALGCIVAELLTGKAPFGGLTLMQVIEAHGRGPVFSEPWPEDVPAGVDTVLRRALARNTATRYSYAMSFWQALNHIEHLTRTTGNSQTLAEAVVRPGAKAQATLAADDVSPLHSATQPFTSDDGATPSRQAPQPPPTTAPMPGAQLPAKRRRMFQSILALTLLAVAGIVILAMIGRSYLAFLPPPSDKMLPTSQSGVAEPAASTPTKRPSSTAPPRSTAAAEPTARPIRVGQTLLADDFSNPKSSGLVEEVSDTTTYAFVDGAYIINLKKPKYVVWSSYNGSYDDIDIQVDTTFDDGPLDSAVGVLFRYQDEDNFYYYRVSADGSYNLTLYTAGEHQVLVDWTEAPEIRGRQQVNHLSVEAVGDHIRLLVNGTLLVEVSDDTLAKGKIALAVNTFEEGGATFKFDNLIVRGR